MESDPEKLFWLQAHTNACLRAYATDSARIEEYHAFLPLDHMAAAAKTVRKTSGHTTPPANASAASPVSSASASALHRLLEWIGSSSKLYEFTCAQLRELIVAAERAGRFSDAQCWRSLRVDLIMRLHETQHDASSAPSRHSASSAAHGGGPSSPAKAASSHLASELDRLHTWVWCLDAGVKDHALLSGKLLEKLLGSEGGGTGFLEKLKPKNASVARAMRADLGILASHPFIILTLLNTLVAALSECVETERTPAEHDQIKPLTSLLSLALTPCAELLQAPSSSPAPSIVQMPETPHAEDLLTGFFPLIAELIVYAQLGEMEPLNPKLSVRSSFACMRAV